MHFVLRSSRARGTWSFWTKQNKSKVRAIVSKFSRKYGVRIHSMANVGNHLHLHMKLSNRPAYFRFIRAITAAIAMAVTGASRWKPLSTPFWDYRPFSRVIVGHRGFLTLRDYIQINRLEGFGFAKSEARYMWEKLSEAGAQGTRDGP